MRVTKADKFAANVLPIIRELQSNGMSLRGIANALTERGVKTSQGGKWQATTVLNVTTRTARAEKAFDQKKIKDLEAAHY